MNRWGFRASFLSAVTKVNAGQNASNNQLNPNVLYMVLGVIILIIRVKIHINFPVFINPIFKI